MSEKVKSMLSLLEAKERDLADAQAACNQALQERKSFREHAKEKTTEVQRLRSELKQLALQCGEDPRLPAAIESSALAQAVRALILKQMASYEAKIDLLEQASADANEKLDNVTTKSTDVALVVQRIRQENDEHKAALNSLKAQLVSREHELANTRDDYRRVKALMRRICTASNVSEESLLKGTDDSVLNGPDGADSLAGGTSAIATGTYDELVELRIRTTILSEHNAVLSKQIERLQCALALAADSAPMEERHAGSQSVHGRSSSSDMTHIEISMLRAEIANLQSICHAMEAEYIGIIQSLEEERAALADRLHQLDASIDVSFEKRSVFSRVDALRCSLDATSARVALANDEARRDISSLRTAIQQITPKGRADLPDASSVLAVAERNAIQSAKTPQGVASPAGRDRVSVADGLCTHSSKARSAELLEELKRVEEQNRLLSDRLHQLEAQRSCDISPAAALPGAPCADCEALRAELRARVGEIQKLTAALCATEATMHSDAQGLLNAQPQLVCSDANMSADHVRKFDDLSIVLDDVERLAHGPSGPASTKQLVELAEFLHELSGLDTDITVSEPLRQQAHMMASQLRSFQASLTRMRQKVQEARLHASSLQDELASGRLQPCTQCQVYARTVLERESELRDLHQRLGASESLLQALQRQSRSEQPAGECCRRTKDALMAERARSAALEENLSSCFQHRHSSPDQVLTGSNVVPISAGMLADIRSPTAGLATPVERLDTEKLSQRHSSWMPELDRYLSGRTPPTHSTPTESRPVEAHWRSSVPAPGGSKASPLTPYSQHSTPVEPFGVPAFMTAARLTGKSPATPEGSGWRQKAATSELRR